MFEFYENLINSVIDIDDWLIRIIGIKLSRFQYKLALHLKKIGQDACQLFRLWF